MAIALKSHCFPKFDRGQGLCSGSTARVFRVSTQRRVPVMAAISTVSNVGISETFVNLKKEGKVRTFVGYVDMHLGQC